MKSKNNCIKLNKWFLAVIVFLFGVICAKIIYIAVSPLVDGVDLRELALSNKTHKKIIRANRGNIYDIVGEVLAQDVRAYTVIAYLADARTEDITKPRHVIDKKATADALSELLGMTPEYIIDLLNYDAYQVELGPGGRGITELKKQLIEALELPGVDFIQTTKRDYPYGDFASYIIGYARKNNEEIITGEMGIESKYNDKLKGKDGSIIYQRDPHGYQISNTPELIDPSLDGYDIYLTIDSNIQMYLENAVLELEKKGSKWATITVADAKTGAISGSASSPSFDPNIVNVTNYNNPLTSYAYEPGSTMKIFSFMAAMEHGLYNGDDTYESGHIIVDDFKIRDWNTTGWGTISYNKGFTYSSNTATVRLAQKLGREKLTDFYEKLGFSQKTEIELPNEYDGKIEMYAESELASAAYGQGITATPIQNIQALTALTNSGTTLKPYIISKIIDPNTKEIIHKGVKTELNKVASKETINNIIDLMDQTVNGDDINVTGRSYHTSSLVLVGKTGNSQYINASGKYSSGTFNNIRSFAGVFPKDDPQYIIHLSVKDFIGGSFELGSITKSIVESIAKYKNIEDRTDDTDQSKIIKLSNYVNKNSDKVYSELELTGVSPVLIGDGDTIIKQFPSKHESVTTNTKIFLLTNSKQYTMIDATGWSSSEVKSLANLMKLSYNINGYGKVSGLSIKPGTIINKNDILEVTLDNRSE